MLAVDEIKVIIIIIIDEMWKGNWNGGKGKDRYGVYGKYMILLVVSKCVGRE